MKKIILIVSLLVANSAFAFPILICNNPASGAAIYLTQYANQAPYYQMNGYLVSNLEGQLGAKVADHGSGGVTQGSNSFSFASGSLVVSSADMGPAGLSYQLTYGSATFYFNSGECKY